MGMKSPEHDAQTLLVAWFDLAYKPLKGRLCAFANGGARHIATAKKLKAEGVRAGVPDLLLPVPCGGYHGLFIEMKAPKPYKSTVSEAQKDWLNFLSAQGYFTSVCYGFDDAKKVIEDYLKDFKYPAKGKI